MTYLSSDHKCRIFFFIIVTVAQCLQNMVKNLRQPNEKFHLHLLPSALDTIHFKWYSFLLVLVSANSEWALPWPGLKPICERRGVEYAPTTQLVKTWTQKRKASTNNFNISNGTKATMTQWSGWKKSNRGSIIWCGQTSLAPRQLMECENSGKLAQLLWETDNCLHILNVREIWWMKHKNDPVRWKWPTTHILCWPGPYKAGNVLISLAACQRKNHHSTLPV